MSRSSSSTQPHPTKENPYILSKKIKYSRKSPIFSRKIPTQCVLHCVCCSGCVAVCCSVLQWMCGNVLLSKDPYSAIPFREQVYSLAKDPCILLKEPYVLSIYPNTLLDTLPAFSQKSPMFSHYLPTPPYPTEEKPCIFLKEPYNLPKEPYNLSQKSPARLKSFLNAGFQTRYPSLVWCV